MDWFWFWMWLLFVVSFLLVPLGYGTGYRDWGRPRYRRTASPDRATPSDRTATMQAEREETTAAAGWGVLAVLFWVFFLIAVSWLVWLVIAAAAVAV